MNGRPKRKPDGKNVSRHEHTEASDGAIVREAILDGVALDVVGPQERG